MTKQAFTDDVFAEKSLYDVYLSSRQVGATKFNVTCMMLSSLVALAYVVMNAITGVDNSSVISAIAKISGSIITVTTAILGFLIAGFSIFVSATPVSVLRMLVQTPYEDTTISCFKQIMFNFLNVFTVYLIAMTISLAVNTATPLGWSPIIRHHVDIRLVTTFNSTVLALMSLLAVYIILRLKSFIWTMYQSLIINMMLDLPLSK